MLNSLASYLLGYPGSTVAASPADADGPTSARASVPSVDVDVRLSAVEADDDWLLVDKTGKNHRTRIIQNSTNILTPKHLVRAHSKTVT